jgi:hypothetical protein
VSGNKAKKGLGVTRASWRTFAAGGLLVVLAGCTAAPGSGCSPEATASSTTTPGGSTTTEAPGSTTTTEPGSSSTTTPPGSSTTTEPPGSTTTTLPDGGGEVVDVDEVSVGDCITPVGDDLMVGSVELIDCAEAHEAEVYAQFEVPGDALPGTPGYPGGSELTWYAQDECQDRFADAMGESYWDSPHDLKVITPSFSTWDVGDRTITCLVVGAGGADLVGSVLA